MKRPESSFIQFRERIPADVLSKAAGLTLAIPVGGQTVSLTLSARAVEVKFSLRTRDPRQAAARHAEAKAHLAGFWQSLRDGPRRLTHKEVLALAGEMYRTWIKEHEDDPGPPEFWEHIVHVNTQAGVDPHGQGPFYIGAPAHRRAAIEARFGSLVAAALARRALVVDSDSQGRLLEQLSITRQRSALRLQQNALGDYSADPVVKRFPEWPEPAPAPPSPATPPLPRPVSGTLSLAAIATGWADEANRTGRSPSTMQGYLSSFAKLRDFLSHDDARRVTPEEIVAFKDHRLSSLNPRNGRLISPKTVNDGDLAGLKTIFGWAVRNRKLPTNPAAGISVARPRAIVLRSKGFTDAEAQALLAAATRYQNRREQPNTVAAKRWVPWLCAYTGARLGEIVQLRRTEPLEAWLGYRPAGSARSFFAFRNPAGDGWTAQWGGRELVLSWWAGATHRPA